MGEVSGKKPVTVYAAMGANALVALSKFLVAAITRSSAMLSEGIHSLADTGNQALLLLGIHLSRRPADANHPFGYGKEIYFWSLIVAIVLFGVGGGVLLYEGIMHLQEPVELTRPQGNYVVIGLAALFESTSFVIAYHKLRSANPADPILLSIHRSKNPEVFLVVFEDAAALAGLVIAFQGVFLSHQFEVPALDAIASLIIALILMVVAVFLAYESRELLLGEATGDEIISAIKKIVQDDSLVRHAERPVTMHLGPDEVLLNMDMNFVDKIDSTQVAAAVDRIEKAIQSQFPDINRIYFEAEGLKRIGG
ncbi:MAG: cation diffusion facilitator family transporter [Anaerolineales bacterium]